jgi:hypothetical protein
MLAFADLAPALVQTGAVDAEDLAAFLALADDPRCAWRESLTVATWGHRRRGAESGKGTGRNTGC